VAPTNARGVLVPVEPDYDGQFRATVQLDQESSDWPGVLFLTAIWDDKSVSVRNQDLRDRQ
jgi:hypothetical protein